MSIADPRMSLLPPIARQLIKLQLAKPQKTPITESVPPATLNLYPRQAEIINDPARFTITEATTKAGKTISHLYWQLTEIYKLRRGNHWWVAPISDQADIAYRRAQDFLRGYVDASGKLERIGEAVPFTKNDTRKYIDVYGGRWWFKSADNPDSLYGEDVYTLVPDEISRWKEQAWTACYSTLTATKGRAKLIGNVKGRRNFAYKLARKAEAGEPDWAYYKLTAQDAIEGGVIDAGIVEQARRDLPEHVFKELYEAEAADDGANPFGLAAIDAAFRPSGVRGKPVAFGVDLAKSVDYTWVIGLDKDGCEVVSERWQSPWGETKRRVLDLIKGVPTLMDSTGVGDPIVEELQGIHSQLQGFKYSSASKQQLMLGLASALQSGALHLNDPMLRLELEAFEFIYTATGVRYSAPDGQHDDGVNALALAERMRQTFAPGPTATQTKAALSALVRR